MRWVHKDTIIVQPLRLYWVENASVLLYITQQYTAAAVDFVCLCFHTEPPNKPLNDIVLTWLSKIYSHHIVKDTLFTKHRQREPLPALVVKSM